VTEKPSLTLKRRLPAPPSKVFAAWIEPDRLARWFGPHGSEVLEAEAEPRIGGRFRILMRTPDGEEHGVSGDYREVVPDERLVFTWAWRSTPERESLVTLSFDGDGGGTLLTLHHAQFFDEKARAGHEHGWTESLERLERYLA
jgi:uncharacterized protein YndB with AHSA1/START domain